MKVLSLFDGMSCGRLALERAGIKVDKYYTSEIDKYASAVARYNWPNSIELGDINEWENWDIDKPDIIIGGSPCQGFSTAGKGLNFDDPRSKLFFSFVDIINFYKPKYFLLENVKMKKEWKDFISGLMGEVPIEINSSLVSAQNRRRLYWSNIPNITIPEDKGIELRDILDEEYDFIYQLPHGYIRECIKYINKYPSLCAQSPASKYKLGIDSNYDKGSNLKSYSNGRRQLIIDYLKKSKMEGSISYRILKLKECERLQTLSDNYTQYGLYKDQIKKVSNSQRYKMIGNGWTVDVITHILRGLNG